MDQVFQLREFPIHIGIDGTVNSLDRFTGEAGWYDSYLTRFGGQGGHLISWNRFDSSWDKWHLFPNGDELVACLEGSLRILCLSLNESTELSLVAGEYTIIEAGTWHTADLPAGTSAVCLFVTSGGDVEHRLR